MMKVLIGTALFLCLSIANAQQPDPLFKGKIAVEWLNHSKVYVFFDGKLQNTFLLLNDATSKVSLGQWMNKKDLLLATLFEEKEKEGTIKGSLITLDITGKIIDTLYKAKPYEIIQHTEISPDDRFLFTGFRRGKDSRSPYAIWYKSISFEIWDMKTMTELKRIDDFCPAMFLYVPESPWSPDSKQFVYGVLGSGDKSVHIEGELNAEPIDDRKRGIYIYDVEADSHTMILTEGEGPIWSPVGNLIAYTKDKQVFCYDVDKGISYRVWKPKKYEGPLEISWAPDGKHIFLRSEREYLNLFPFYRYYEKWINVDTKKVSLSKGPLVGGKNHMTWKRQIP